jgi:hypothetical protein
MVVVVLQTIQHPGKVSPTSLLLLLLLPTSPPPPSQPPSSLPLPSLLPLSTLPPPPLLLQLPWLLVAATAIVDAAVVAVVAETLLSLSHPPLPPHQLLSLPQPPLPLAPHCRQSNLLSTPLLCHPLHAYIFTPLRRRMIADTLLPTTARVCHSLYRLVVVFLSLPRIGDLRPSSAPSIQRTRPTPPHCRSKNALTGLWSCGRRNGCPCACEQPILTIPFARRMYNWGDELGGGWEGMHAFVRHNFHHVSNGSGVFSGW